MQTLGEYLRNVREGRRLSIRHVAARVRISAPYLSDIELGRRYPSERVLADLAKALHTPLDDLRRYDPRALSNLLLKRLRADPEYGHALLRLIIRCSTTEELLRLIEP